MLIPLLSPLLLYGLYRCYVTLGYASYWIATVVFINVSARLRLLRVEPTQPGEPLVLTLVAPLAVPLLLVVVPVVYAVNHPAIATRLDGLLGIASLLGLDSSCPASREHRDATDAEPSGR